MSDPLYRIKDVVTWESPSLHAFAVGKVIEVVSPPPAALSGSGYFGYSYVIQTPDSRTYGVNEPDIILIRHEMI